MNKLKYSNKSNFPYFQNNVDVTFLDNASTTQKPARVLNKLLTIYNTNYASVNRGGYTSSVAISEMYEKARYIAQQFIGATYLEEVVFTSGATEAINILTRILSDTVQIGDEIILTKLEHTSNSMPWLLLAARKSLVIKFMDLIYPQIILDDISNYLSPKTKIVALSHCSNGIGIENDIFEITRLIKKYRKDIIVVIDACQSAHYLDLNVHRINCDVMILSAHKLYGPNGSGILYIKKDLHSLLTYNSVGGGMINNLSDLQNLTKCELPQMLEVGTVNAPAAIAFAEALLFINEIGKKYLKLHYQTLNRYFSSKLAHMKDFQLVAHPLGPILSIYSPKYNAVDIGLILNKLSVYVRTGALCNYHLLDYLQLDGILRVSFAMYTDTNDIDKFFTALEYATYLLS